MGYYIETPMIKGKADYLKERYKAEEIEEIGSLNEISKEDMALVCVLENGMWDAVAYIYDDNELKRALPTSRDNRKRTWLLMDKTLVENLSNYRRERV
jgi:hypothetical protein